MNEKLATTLQIRPSEARMVASVGLLFALIELGRAVGGSTADALFFLRFGVDNLPYMYIILGVLNFGCALIYAAMLGRGDKGRFFSALFGLFALTLVAERLAITLNLRALYPVLWLSVNIISVLLGTLEWNAAGEVCDARQGKRLFPLFVSSGILGGLVGSLIIGPAAQVLGTENLMLVDAILMALGMLVLWRISRQFFPPPKQTAEQSTFIADLSAGFDYVRRSPLLQLI